MATTQSEDGTGTNYRHTFAVGKGAEVTVLCPECRTWGPAEGFQYSGRAVFNVCQACRIKAGAR